MRAGDCRNSGTDRLAIEGRLSRRNAVGCFDGRMVCGDDVRRDLTRHLARIGNNLNQVARGINRAVLTGEKIEAVKVLVELAAIRAAMEELW